MNLTMVIFGHINTDTGIHGQEETHQGCACRVRSGPFCQVIKICLKCHWVSFPTAPDGNIIHQYTCMLWFCLNLQQRTYAVTLSLLPPPRWDGEENQKEKRQKLMGWDENSLREWRREKKTTINNTDKKRVQHAMFSPPDAQLAPE